MPISGEDRLGCNMNIDVSAAVPPSRSKLPPLAKSSIPKLPKDKDFHLYLCCAEEDMQRTVSITKDISSKGYRCAEFFRDGAPNLPVFSQVESFVRRSVWIGLVLTDIFLKSCETNFQIEVFLRHVLQAEEKKCIIPLITNKAIHKHIPSVLLPFTTVCTYKEKWLSHIDKVLTGLPSNDLSDICGNKGHVNLASMCGNVVVPSQVYTFCGQVDKKIIALHKQRDAKIHLKRRRISDEYSTANRETMKDQEEKCEGFLALAPLKRPFNPKTHLKHRPSVSSVGSETSVISSASTMSGTSAISSDRQTDSGIPEDSFTDDEMPYDSNFDVEDEELEALQKSYKDALSLGSDSEDMATK